MEPHCALAARIRAARPPGSPQADPGLLQAFFLTSAKTSLEEGPSRQHANRPPKITYIRSSHRGFKGRSTLSHPPPTKGPRDNSEQSTGIPLPPKNSEEPPSPWGPAPHPPRLCFQTAGRGAGGFLEFTSKRDCDPQLSAERNTPNKRNESKITLVRGLPGTAGKCTMRTQHGSSASISQFSLLCVMFSMDETRDAGCK